MNWVILKMTAYNLNDQFKELVEQTLTEQKIQSETAEVIKVSVKTRISFRIISQLWLKKYTTTGIKSIIFLTSIAYIGINKEDFYNGNFIFDVYLLVTKNLNPFSL